MNIWQGIKRFFGNIWNFIKDTRAELKKVVWPTWGQVRVYTVVVVFSMVALGIVMWGTDAVLSVALGAIIGK